MAKILYLVRHAESSWHHPNLSDFQRPLNKRGLHEAREMAQRLREQGKKPQCVMVSPALRAKQTAEILAETLKIDEICYVEPIYEAAPETLYKLIEERNDSCANVMLIGHNPSMTRAVQQLANTPIKNMPTAGIAELSLNINHWHELYPGCATLLNFDYPGKSGQNPTPETN